MEEIGRDDGAGEAASGRRAGWHTLVPPAVCAIAWAAAALLARAHGLSCVSDDDFARVTIAQRFAHAPTLDPSGTSWLPLPFWLTGLAMLAFGRSLLVAHAVAIAQAAASGALLHLAGRRAGLGAASATLGALLPLALPLDRILAAATVPEIPTAALVVYAVFAASSAPVTAGAAVLAASLSRYEAWPAALLLAVVVLFARSTSDPRWRSLTAAGLSVLGPLGWIAWNRFSHGDPLHFAARVAGYRQSLGATDDALAYATAVAREAGAVVALALAAVVALRRHGVERFGVALGAAALLVIAPTLAALGGGAPTHHPERAMVAVWMIASVVAAGAGPEAALLVPGVRPFAIVASAVALIVAHGALRVRSTWDSLGPPRTGELAFGRAVAAELPLAEPFLIVPASFGYLAILAALERPEDARVVVLHAVDPRSSLESDPFASLAALTAAASRERVRWVIADAAQTARLRELGVVAIPLPGGAVARVR